MIEGTTQKETLQRLRKIHGQAAGLLRMVEEQRYCIDVLTQIAAVERALHRVAEIILRNHMETCVATAFRSKDGRDRREKTAELMRIFSSMRPK